MSMPTTGEWVPVAERLPDLGARPWVPVIVWDGEDIYGATFEAAGPGPGVFSTWGPECVEDITHWMAMPQPPWP